MNFRQQQDTSWQEHYDVVISDISEVALLLLVLIFSIAYSYFNEVRNNMNH
jgi:hypothetical protein